MKWRNGFNVLKINASVWTVSFLLNSPLFYGYTTKINKKNVTDCSNNYWSDTSRQIYFTVNAFFVYMVPILVMLFAHINISKSMNKNKSVIDRNRSLVPSTSMDCIKTSESPNQNKTKSDSEIFDSIEDVSRYRWAIFY